MDLSNVVMHAHLNSKGWISVLIVFPLLVDVVCLTLTSGWG